MDVNIKKEKGLLAGRSGFYWIFMGGKESGRQTRTVRGGDDAELASSSFSL